MAPDNDLDRWIGDLRGYLQRGALMELPPVELGHGTGCLSGETTVRIMLADLKDLDNSHGSWAEDAIWRDMRRHNLLENFERLRELLG